eukprot:s5983_g5.t1
MNLAAVKLLLLHAVLSAEAGHARHKQNVSLLDNFRAPQPLGGFRHVYRSAAASHKCLPDCGLRGDCPKHGSSNACLKPELPTKTKRSWGMSTHLHWSYYDQDSRCCPCLSAGLGGDSVVAPNVSIALGPGFKKPLKKLQVSNNGHSMTVIVCGRSGTTCEASASFGTWPKAVRGLNSTKADRYFLEQFHMHWGSDDSKGSEHLLCGQRRAAELHMVFVNERVVPEDRSDPDSGTLLTVLGTMVEGGAKQDNAAFEPILAHLSSKVKHQNQVEELPDVMSRDKASSDERLVSRSTGLTEGDESPRKEGVEIMNLKARQIAHEARGVESPMSKGSSSFLASPRFALTGTSITSSPWVPPVAAASTQSGDASPSKVESPRKAREVILGQEAEVRRRLQWREELDRNLRRLMTDVELGRDPVMKHHGHKMVCDQFDRLYGWFKDAGDKEEYQRHPSLCLLEIDVQAENFD